MRIVNGNWATRDVSRRECDRRWVVYWKGAPVAIKRRIDAKTSLGHYAGSSFIEPEFVLLTPVARRLAGDPKAKGVTL